MTAPQQGAKRLKNGGKPMYGEVRSTQQLTPSMVRVVLGGGDLDGFVSTSYTDQYINAQFFPGGARYTAPFDPADYESLGRDKRPRGRRYTVRHWNNEKQELTIDFVVHGDHGYVGPWAQRAQPGDFLQFRGPSGAYAPDKDAAWHLMAGDESALPAIGASLETLTPGARAVVLVVVDDPDHELELTTPGELNITWLHRRNAEEPETLLPDAVAALDFASGPVDVFVHGEAGEVRAVRKHLLSERRIDRKQASISPYWRRTMTDEEWRTIKSSWLKDQAQDV